MKYMPTLAILLLVTAAVLQPAAAGEPAATTAADTLPTVGPDDPAAADTALLDLGELDAAHALSDEELGSHRARENIELASITINDQDQDGEVSDNVATGNTNGDNLINGEAFSNSSGFLSTVQNTGNNVLIQNSTIINVSVETPAE